MSHYSPETEESRQRDSGDAEAAKNENEPKANSSGVADPKLQPPIENQNNGNEKSGTNSFLGCIRKFKAAIEAFGVIVVVFYTGAAFWQGCEAQRSAIAATKSADAATIAALAAKAANGKTQAAIDQNRNEFAATLGQMEAQTAQQRRAADAAASSINASVESLREEQRAWLGFGVFYLTVAPTVGGHIVIQVNGQNTGRTPAMYLGLKYGLAIGEPMTRTNEPDWASISASNLGLVFPGETFRSTIDSARGGKPLVLTKRIVDLYDSGHAAVYLWVRYDYYDIYGVEHWATGCYGHAHTDAAEWFGDCGGRIDRNSELKK